ncbi:MAG: hypothetical protein RIC87_20540 [Kiloniellales bacterium]
MDDRHSILDQGAALQLQLQPCRPLVQVGFWRGARGAAALRLAEALAFEMPADGRQVAGFPDGWAYRIAPDRLLLLSDRARPLLQECRSAVGQDGAVSDIGHAKRILDLDGSEAVSLLTRGIAIDLGPAGLTPGAFAQTRLHDASILVHRLSPERFRLLIPTSFAAALVDWFVESWAMMQY